VWLDGASARIVESFWQRCGEPEPFPRCLERPILLALPVAIVKLPRLKTADVENWLGRRGSRFRFGCRSRRVRGCLLANKGKAIIFVDGTDPDDERRFTLAHEIAHFMVDYWAIREMALRKFGADIADVIDGERLPTPAERVHAILGSIPIGMHSDLMDRDQTAEHMGTHVWGIENRADKIALALLAPPAIILAEARGFQGPFERQVEETIAMLGGQFGIPRIVAESYARSLLNAAGRRSSWVETIALNQ
jgi:Zn-dependent peptidase ImmA (M78 family)